MKKVLVVLLIVVAGVMAFAGQYQWGGTPVIGNKIATWESIMDTTLVTSRGLSLPYFVAVTPNHKAWVAGYGSSPRANRTIWVYDAEFEVVDSIPANYQWDGVDYLMGSTRFGQTTGDGNVAYANWGPEFITVFDQDDYSVVAQSPWCNTSGGMEAFVYNGEQYYITQQILAAHITLWDEDFNIIDTLWGGGGGRNLACTSDGSVIIAPSLGGTYFMEYAGNPVDGYTGPDTITLEDLGILNTGDRTAGGMGNLMYVSRGPNDYIWLMSRDAAVDGVYVVDPKNDYEVKLFTTTDSSATSPEDFSLGMAMDNQWLIWRNLGVIDSADFLVVNPNPPYNTYQTAPQLRAPCQVAYYFDGPNAKEYLYMADYYGYTLKLWTRDTETSVRDVAVIGEKGFKLEVAYPNPFNPSTLVPFSLTSNADVTIEVFDVAGKKVQTLVNEYKLAGNYNVTFDASSLASGNYLIKMTVGNHSEAQKVSLVK